MWQMPAVDGAEIPVNEIPSLGGIGYVSVKHYVQGILIGVVETVVGDYLNAAVCHVELSASVDVHDHYPRIEIW